MEYDREYVDKFFNHIEPETGRCFELDKISGVGGSANGSPKYEVMGVTRLWRYSQERIQELIGEGSFVQGNPGAVPRHKRYCYEMPGVS